MGRRFNTRKGQTFFFFYLLCLFFLSVSLLRQCSWYCIILLLLLLEMSWNMFPVTQICKTGSFRRGSNAEPGYEVWCWYLWTWRNNRTSHFKNCNTSPCYFKIIKSNILKSFSTCFSAIAVEINLTDTVVVVSLYGDIKCRRYSLANVSFSIQSHLKKKRKMQFSILTQYGTAWWKMIPQEIFGKYLQTVSSYSVLNFPSH